MNEYFAFQWHILDDCDQRCKHCYIFTDEKKSLNTMNFEDMELILENALDMCEKLDKTPYFAVTGGDPILHSNFWNLLELLSKNDLNYSIMGNPYHLTSKVCKRLKRLNCRQYQMSIDGLRKTHDYFRQPGSYDITLQKIKTLREAGIRTSIMTTVSKRNANQIPWIIDEVVRANVDLYSFARYCPVNPNDDVLTPYEYRNLLDKVWNKFIEYKDFNTLFSLKDHLWTLYLYENGLFNIPENLGSETYGGCSCGKDHLTILPNADVYACRRMESHIGNALKEDLIDIFKSNSLKEFNQYDKFEKCRSCELLQFCRGCPAVSYGVTKNMYSPDSQCWI